jgi:nitrite reductase/ring-hydroxylating ferredoxin subunit
VCPWHGARYDVETGRMVRGPQGVYAKVPGLGSANIALTRVFPLRRGEVVERDATVLVVTSGEVVPGGMGWVVHR